MDYLKQSFVIQIGGPLVVSDWQIHGFVFWTGLSENYHFCAKHLGMLSSCIVVFRGGRAQFLKVVYNSTLLILSWFLWQTFGGVIRLDCCLREGGYNFKNECTIQYSWFCPDFCAAHLGELSSWIVVFGPCQGGRAQFGKVESCLARDPIVCLEKQTAVPGPTVQGLAVRGPICLEPPPQPWP